MLVFILACIVSFVPCIGLYLWLRKNGGGTGEEGRTEFKAICKKTLVQGILTLFPVVLLSGVSYVLLRLTGLQNTNPLLYQALYTFGVLALMEELAKYLTFRRVLKKTDSQYSWLDITILMTIVGIGFGLIESILYLFGASVPVVLVRGLCIPHAGYGFIVGYFYGKGIKNDNPGLKWIGFVIAWLLHGLYDFSLSEEFVAINENLVFVGVLLALLDIVLVIMLIVFVRKAKKHALSQAAVPQRVRKLKGRGISQAAET